MKASNTRKAISYLLCISVLVFSYQNCGSFNAAQEMVSQSPSSHFEFKGAAMDIDDNAALTLEEPVDVLEFSEAARGEADYNVVSNANADAELKLLVKADKDASIQVNIGENEANELSISQNSGEEYHWVSYPSQIHLQKGVNELKISSASNLRVKSVLIEGASTAEPLFISRDIASAVAAANLSPTSSTILTLTANQHSRLNSPFKMEKTESSPSGYRVFTTQQNKGSVEFEFNLDSDQAVQFSGLFLADSSRRNQFAIKLDDDASINWTLPVSSSYAWSTHSKVFNLSRGQHKLVIEGVTAYTRLAAVRILKMDSTATPTPVPTSTPQPTATPKPSPTATPKPTATPQPTATPKPTATPQPTATPKPTATPIPGGGGSNLDPAKAPGQNFDLLLWKLTLPVDSSGNKTGTAVEIKPLTATYKNTTSFFTGSDGAMVFVAPTDGATTSGSKYPRSELREMTASYANAAWTVEQTGYMRATLAVNEVPTTTAGAKGRIIVGQIHGPDDELCRLYYDNGRLYFIDDKAGSSPKETEFVLKSSSGATTNIPLNAKFSYVIKANKTALTVSATYNGVEYKAVDPISSFWPGKGLYYKAGVYLGVGKVGGSAGTQGTGQGKVSFYELTPPSHDPSLQNSDGPVATPTPVATPAPTATPKPSMTPAPTATPVQPGTGSNPPLTGNVIRVSTIAQLNSTVASAKAGDTIVLAAGTYKDAIITARAQGSASAPVTIRPEVMGSVKLTGISHIIMGGNYVYVMGLHFTQGYSGNTIFVGTSTNQCVNCKLLHVRMDNQSVVAPSARASKNSTYDNGDYTSTKWVHIHGQRNEIAYSTFQGKAIRGVVMTVWRTPGVANYHHIHHNEFLDMPRLEVDGNEYEVIRVGSSEDSLSDSFTTVESNLFEKCDGEVEIVSNKSGGNTYRYNTFRNSGGMFTSRHGKNSLVEGNYFLQDKKEGSGGIRIVDSGHIVLNNHIQDVNGDNQFRAAMILSSGQANAPLNGYAQVKSSVIASNAIIDNVHHILVGYGKSELKLMPEANVLANNVVRAGSGDSVLSNKAASGANSFMNNLYQAASISTAGWNAGSVATSVSAQGVKMPTGAALEAMRMTPEKLNALGLTSEQLARVSIKSGTIYEKVPVITRGMYGAGY